MDIIADLTTAVLVAVVLVIVTLSVRRIPRTGLTRVIVVRHASEVSDSHKAAVASTPLLKQALGARCTVIDAPRSDILLPSHVEVIREAVAHDAVLLFPSTNSASLDAVAYEDGSSSVRDGKRPRALVVVDGSWRTAGRLIACNRILQPESIRHVHLSAERAGVSAYMTSGLRSEPRHGFVSTAEATATALAVLGEEHDSAPRTILRQFESFARQAAEDARASASEKDLTAMALRQQQCDGGGHLYTNRDWALLDVRRPAARRAARARGTRKKGRR